MYRILVVEDDKTLSQGIELALRGEGYQFIRVDLLREATKTLESQAIDLVILDLNLPDGDGLDFLGKVRKQHQIPVIILTARDLELDIVTGIELGADDYITKPFSLMVLRARVNLALRKYKQIKEVQQTKESSIEQNTYSGIHSGNSEEIRNKTTGIEILEQNTSGQEIVIDEFRFSFETMNFSKRGQAIELSKTEQKLLRLLVINRGNTLLRGDLVDKIWTDGATFVDENALSVTVKRLRDKLEDTPSKPKYIKTVYGLGYTWAVKA